MIPTRRQEIGQNRNVMAKLLIVDDEELLREVLVDHLKDEGHETAEASNGKEALGLYASFNPDLVISDINMPVMDGYQFLSALQKRHPEVEDIPFFFLSALSDSGDQLKGLNFGIDEYLCKPIDFNILTARIELSLRRQQRMDQKIQDALKRSASGKAATSTKTDHASAKSPEADGQARRTGVTGTGLLASKRPKLSKKQQEDIIATNSRNNFHSAGLINKLGRKVGISRLFLEKEKCNYLAMGMFSSEFDSDFFHEVNASFFQTLDSFLEEIEHFAEKSIIIPSFFQYVYHERIRDQYIKYIDYIEDKYCIAIVSEIIHLPDRFSAYADTLKPLSSRKNVQIVEIRKPRQLQDIDLRALRIGAISMDYISTTELNDKELDELRRLLAKWEINFYIKEITNGKIGAAQQLDPDLLSVSI